MTRRWRGLGMLGGTFALGVAVGTIIWGPRPTLPNDVHGVAAVIAQSRCGPAFRFGIPFNAHGLQKVAHVANSYVHPDTGIFVELMYNDTGKACQISDVNREWESAEIASVYQLFQSLGPKVVGDDVLFEDLRAKSGFDIHGIYRLPRGKSPFVMMFSSTVEGDRNSTTLVVGKATFEEAIDA